MWHLLTYAFFFFLGFLASEVKIQSFLKKTASTVQVFLGSPRFYVWFGLGLLAYFVLILGPLYLVVAGRAKREERGTSVASH